jgi:hypothetical protein
MRIATATVFCVAALAIAGCSKPGKQGGTGSVSTAPEGQAAGVDYHSLISYGAGASKYYANDPNLPAMKHAKTMCAEAGGNSDGNPWCDAVHKAMVCGSSLKRSANETGPEWASFVEKHPSIECPPK